ncbi:toxin-antitoxin system HicB family antitoxin [Paenibacillus sp. GCM10023250]|uniref:toxin-antitoxin system HicB family antitoxin n=1 Tax=Paenibacillus sp. GCM10023250 TaxID=3252648 RepID=UPI0036120C58
MVKDLAYYMGLPYTVKFRPIKDDPNYPNGYYYGGFEELEGCNTDAPTVVELIEELEEVKRVYLETKLQFGDPIPEPDELPSGEIKLRMPRTLHWRLAAEAKREEVSLNQYMVSKLSR